MKHVFLINPRAGKGDRAARLQAMAKRLAAAHGLEVSCLLTDCPGAAESLARALAETGEIINIDGVGNRLAGTLFGHEKVYFVIGRNKLAPDYEKAVWRARNVAGPHRAQQLGKKTPCAVKADRCYDCKSPDRVCNAMVTLWGPMTGMETEILLVDEDLGL